MTDKYPISLATKRLLERENSDSIGYGFAGWLEEIYDELKLGKQKHSLAKWKVVLDGLDREQKNGCELFEKKSILLDARRGRLFVIKRENETNDRC